jgi:hypothetical protein
VINSRTEKLQLLATPFLSHDRGGVVESVDGVTRRTSLEAKTLQYNTNLFKYEPSFTSGKTPLVGLIIPKSYLVFNKPNVYVFFNFVHATEPTPTSDKAMTLNSFSLRALSCTKSTTIARKSTQPNRNRSKTNNKIGPIPFLNPKLLPLLQSVWAKSSIFAVKHVEIFLDPIDSENSPRITHNFLENISRAVLFLRRKLYSYGGFFRDPDLVQPYLFTNNRFIHSKYTRRYIFRGFLKNLAGKMRIRKVLKIRNLRFFKRSSSLNKPYRSPKNDRVKAFSVLNAFYPTRRSRRNSRLLVQKSKSKFSTKAPATKKHTSLYARTTPVNIRSFTKLSLPIHNKFSFYIGLSRERMTKSQSQATQRVKPNLPLNLLSANYTLSDYSILPKTAYTTRRQRQRNRSLRGTQRSAPYIKSRALKNYILRSPGFFLVGRVFKALIQFTPRFNKKIYSFLFPNEVKNKLLRKKKKIKYQSAVFKLRNKLKHNKFFSHKAINRNYKNFLLTQAGLKISKLAYNYSSDASSTFVDSKIGYKDKYENIIDSENFYTKGLSTSFKRMEVHIPRIRFKPGYQRI